MTHHSAQDGLREREGMSTVSDSEALHAYRLLLVAEGRECDHPPQFRHPIPDYPSTDPHEWACGVCDVWQAKAPPSDTGLSNDIRAIEAEAELSVLDWLIAFDWLLTHENHTLHFGRDHGGGAHIRCASPDGGSIAIAIPSRSDTPQVPTDSAVPR